MKTESVSRNSFGAVKELLLHDLLDDMQIGPANPLGVVTVPAHYSRIAPIIRKGFGLERGEIQNVAVEESLGLPFRLVQYAGALVTSLALIGIPKHDIAGLEKAHRRFATVFRRPT